MQSFEIGENVKINLALLRRKYQESGMTGRCIVFFHPKQIFDIFDMCGFRHIDNYRYTKPVHPDEVGGADFFHLVPISPMGEFDSSPLPIR